MKWLNGYINCSIKEGSKERFMNLCRYHHIELWDINECNCSELHSSEDEGKNTEKILYFNISVKNYKKIKPLAKKASVVPHIEKKTGGPLIVNKGKKHWTFVIAALVFLVTLYLLSGYVWTIEIIGQNEYTKEMLMESLIEINVHTGMKRSNLNCNMIETYLRKKYDNLSWVSAEEVGSRLRLKVKEGTKTIASEKKESAYHLVASIDGRVESIITNAGTPKVKKGKKVKKGDILIDGRVELKNDSKEIVGQIAVPASGSVIVSGKASFEKKIPNTYQKKTIKESTFTLYNINILGTSFSLKNPLKQFDKSSKYDIITEVCVDEQYFGFEFPFFILKKECIPYEYHTATYTKEEAYQVCKKEFAKFLVELKKQNCAILNKEGKFERIPTGYKLTCTVNGLFTQTSTRKLSKNERSVKTQNGKKN